jgi:hypothetical protein
MAFVILRPRPSVRLRKLFPWVVGLAACMYNPTVLSCDVVQVILEHATIWTLPVHIFINK